MRVVLALYVCLSVQLVFGSHVILVENAPTCFRRVLAGRRALRSHVHRVISCERLEDCRRECATERRFPCESFNYKLDPSFHEKGLCELMTKPIEAFDIHRDFVDDQNYDFYEVDRNSLEPNCEETLRGAGYLHSGFLSSRPSASLAPSYQEGWRDRNDWYRSGQYDRYYGSSKYGRNYQRKYGDRFVPYQIGVSRSNDDRENWNHYGSYYGYDTYYKDRNDYYNSINRWRLNDVDFSRYSGVRPYGYDSDFNYYNLGRKNYRQNQSTGIAYYDNGPGYISYGTGYGNHGSGSYGYGSNRYGYGLASYGTGRYGYGTDGYDYKLGGYGTSHHGYGSSQISYGSGQNGYGSGKYDYGSGLEYGHSSNHGSWIREKWNKSEGGAWSGLEYGETAYYEPGRPYDEYIDRNDEIVIKDCSSRRRAGMSLGSGSIRRALSSSNVVHCETACFNEREFKCVSYSYRYSSSQGSDNCFLSERPYVGLDLSSDSESDVYAMPQDHACSTVTHKPWIESECFWHVRTGSAVSEAAVRSSLTVSGLGACEAECIRAPHFFCRGFSFRFDPPQINDDLENCILTSTPPTSLEVGAGLRPSLGHELYARGNYGRGCEPALYDDIQHHKETQCYLQYDSSAKLLTGAVRGRTRTEDDVACGAACTEAPFRCLSFSFRSNSPPDADNCLLSDVRLFDLQRGVDYEHSKDYLLFSFDLFNGRCWRKVHGKSDDDETYEIPRPIHIPADPYPDTGPSRPGYLPDPQDTPYVPASGPNHPPVYPLRPEGPVHKPGYIPGFKPSYPDSRPGYFEPSQPSGGSYPGYIPRPSGPSGPGYKPGYPPNDAGVRPGGGEKPIPDRGVEEPILVSWRHYTVSGFPCRKGTTCAQNQIAGHWACEPEGGEIGSWDYCCAPTHRCGYSEGFHKPWCYVGPSDDQWRPCSEKYYPYHQHNVPHPSQGHRGSQSSPDRPWHNRPSSYYIDNNDQPQGPYLSEADKRYWDELYKNGPSAYYDKYGNPLPGYARVPTESRPFLKYYHNQPLPSSGQWLPVDALHPRDEDAKTPGNLGVPRYWPVAYLHRGPPPNMTYFQFNETNPKTTTEKYIRVNPPKIPLPPPESRTVEIDLPNDNKIDNKAVRNENTKNLTNEGEPKFDLSPAKTTIPPKTTTIGFNPTTITVITTTTIPTSTDSTNFNATEDDMPKNTPEVETIFPLNVKENNKSIVIKGISGKLEDFGSLEVLDIEDAKTGEKLTDLKSIEAEERQIEAIGRLLASKRNGKLVIEKRSQKDLEARNIAVDGDTVEFNFGNRFSVPERRGTVQRVRKEEIELERNNDKSLEVSETTFVRPPRVLSTTDNIRKAIVNGKVFYDATIREQRDLLANNSRKRTFRQLEDSKAPSVIANSNYGKKKVVRTRNANPVRRVKRVYRKRYNPEEVRRRLLEREKSSKQQESKNLKITV